MSNVVIRAQGGAQVTHVIEPIARPHMIQTVVPRIRIREDYPAKTSRALGIFQIVVAVAGIIVAIMSIVWSSSSADSGYSIWCNAPVIVTGILGIIAANKRKLVIAAFLVMSIISICAMGLMGLIAIIALGVHSDDFSLYWDVQLDCSKCVAVDSLIVVVAILLAVSLFWSSIIAGNCCQTVPATTVGTVSTVNNATVTSFPLQQGYTVQTGQPQYPPPPNAYQPIPPAPGYQPPQAPPPENPPPYAPVHPQQPPAYGAECDNYGGNYTTK